MSSVLLTTYMVVLSGYLIHGAYRAYHGVDASSVQGISLSASTEHIT
jgi:hypothetical protein